MATEPAVKRAIAFFDGQNLLDQAFYDACLDLRDYRPKISN